MALEDFTTYTEVDVGADRIQKTANHIDHLAYRNEITYVYDDKGVDHFGDFEHKIDALSDFAGVNPISAIWMLANDLGSVIPLIAADKTFILLQLYKAATSDFRLYLREHYDSGNYINGPVAISASTTYYLLVKKTGTALVCGIYSTAGLRDAGDGTDGDVGNLALTLHADHQFRYIYPCNSWKDTDTSYHNVDIDNLDLQEAGEAHYKTVTELLGLLDNKTRVKDIHRTTTELLGLIDSIWYRHHPWAQTKTVMELLGLVDTKSRLKEIHRTKTELLGLLDTKLSIHGKYKTITELLGLKDDIRYAKSLVRYEYLKQKIVIDGVEVQEDCLSSDVILKENAVSVAVIIANDEEGKTYLAKANTGDIVTIYYKYEDGDDTWHLTFGGSVVELNPELTMGGEICGIKCYGYGIALKRMRVNDEFGSESKNPTLDTLREIVSSTSDGIISQYVNKILGLGRGSNYNLNYLWVYNPTDIIKYLHFPYEPASSCLKDICNLVAAFKYISSINREPGPHWIVTPEGKLCIAPVGNHDVEGIGEYSIETEWPTFVPKVVQVTRDMLVSRFTKKIPEANYIVYLGKFEKPTNEIWTEGNASLWDKDDEDANIRDKTEDPDPIVGTYCLEFASWDTGDYRYWYPKTGSLGLDVTKIGTKNSIPKLSFYIRKGGWTDNIKVFLISGGNIANRFEMDINSSCVEGKWIHITLPIGPYYNLKEESPTKEWDVIGSPSWSDISNIGFEFHADLHAGEEHVHIDGLRITGIITRGAYNQASIDAYGCKIKLVTDSLVKSCVLDADDDSGMVAQYAKAELIRSISTPIIGSISNPLDPTIMAGQLIRIKASRTDVGYNIDGWMRILEVKHHFAVDSGTTTLTLTDDVMNSYPQTPTDAYNAILKASNPDFQDRNLGDLKGRDIDILQTILENGYA